MHAYVDRVVIRQAGEVVGDHARRFGRDEVVYDLWHYLPVLARKPGALRNGAPFKDWALSPALERVRRRLAGYPDGDRQMVGVHTAVTTDGLDAIEAACAEALAGGAPAWPGPRLSSRRPQQAIYRRRAGRCRAASS